MVFGNLRQRDLVMTHVKNLPKDCSVEVVVPDYLAGTHKFMYVRKTKNIATARDTDDEIGIILLLHIYTRGREEKEVSQT